MAFFASKSGPGQAVPRALTDFATATDFNSSVVIMLKLIGPPIRQLTEVEDQVYNVCCNKFMRKCPFPPLGIRGFYINNCIELSLASATNVAAPA